jgi:hypothetical protein
MLGLAALDSIVVGAWAISRPSDVFLWLQLPELPPGTPKDRLLLWSILGAISLVYALFLVILICWPDRLGPLALPALVGRLIGCGVWLFAMGTDRVDLPKRPCLILAGHDLFWVLVLAAFLIIWWRAWRGAGSPRSRGGTNDEAERLLPGAGVSGRRPDSADRPDG